MGARQTPENGNARLVEFLSSNVSPAEDLADVILDWRDPIAVAIQESRLDRQSQKGFYFAAIKKRWSTQFGAPLPRQLYQTKGTIAENVRPG